MAYSIEDGSSRHTTSPAVTPSAWNRAATASAANDHAPNVRRRSPSTNASRSGSISATWRSSSPAAVKPASSIRSSSSGRVEGEDATCQLAVVQVVENGLELLERIRRRHELVEHELARLVQVD